MTLVDGFKDSRDLLLERNFGLLMLGQLVSQLGENLNKVILFWVVYLFTRIPQAMIIVGIFQTLPPILFFWANGVMLDRFSKRAVMVVVDAVRGCLVLMIPLLYSVHSLSLPVLYLLISLIATASGIFGPALYSAIPHLVPEPRRASANALIQTTGQIGILIGLLLGGILSSLVLSVSSPPNLFRWIAGGFFSGGVFIALLSMANQMVEDLSPDASLWNGGFRRESAGPYTSSKRCSVASLVAGSDHDESRIPCGCHPGNGQLPLSCDHWGGRTVFMLLGVIVPVLGGHEPDRGRAAPGERCLSLRPRFLFAVTGLSVRTFDRRKENIL